MCLLVASLETHASRRVTASDRVGVIEGSSVRAGRDLRASGEPCVPWGRWSGERRALGSTLRSTGRDARWRIGCSAAFARGTPARPWKMSRCASIVQTRRGKSAIRSCSILSGVVRVVKRIRPASRLTWVSTTTPSSIPKALPRITLAVLRPMPGSADSCRMLRGSSPPCSSSRALAMPIRLRVLLRKKPVERMTSSSSAGSAAASERASG